MWRQEGSDLNDRIACGVSAPVRVALLAGVYGLFGTAMAQVPAEVSPGVLQEQLRRAAPQPPADVQLPALPAPAPSRPPPGSENVQVTVRSVEITGNTVVSTADMAAAWAPLTGKEVPLASIYALADTLTGLYRNRGYVLSAVLVPPQTIRDGVVRLQAVEGYVGRVSFDPELVATARMRAQIDAIAREKPLTIATLERQLLLINDLPGVTAQAYFEPGAALGEAYLTVKAVRRPVTGFVGAQNRVSKLLGDVSLEGRVTLNNSFGLDDSHSLLLQTTNRPSRLRSVGYVYNQPLGTDGLALNLFLGRVESVTPFERERMKAASDIATLGLSYPLIRSRAQTLRLRARVNVYNGTQDFADRLLVQEDKVRALRLGAAWDLTDGSGVNFIDAELSKGLTGLGSTPAGATYAQRAGADYGFTKFNFFAGRLQSLGRNLSLQASVQGQWTDDILPPSERAALGGETILRAYNAGELIGDRALAGKLELRWEPQLIDSGRITFYAFAEAGRTTTLNAVGGNAHDSANSTGFGVRGSLTGGLNVYAEVATPHRRKVATYNSRHTRVFAGLSYDF